ncbi:FAD-dependent monooxygenase [Streptomyces mirabilis]|uniref:FAD-dependent monooxygenase n=1 Tax=Streptomyces mirabilis TaxID=68239 RepID=UPI0036846CBF
MDTDVITVGAGPDGPYRVTARYLVGCDGPRSRVRELTGIPFPGTTHPEVNWLGRHALPDSVTRLELQGSGSAGAAIPRRADPSVSPRAQVALRRGHDSTAEALREVFHELLLDEQPLRKTAVP